MAAKLPSANIFRAPRSPSGPSSSNPADRLIVALDFPDAEPAFSLVDRLEDRCRWFKVGLELYLAAGNRVISELRERGFSVFLDLKLHDIPNTVGSAIRSARRLGAGMLTVHAAGGPVMLQAAVEAAGEGPDSPLLLAVTVLTSMDAAQLSAIGIDRSAAMHVDNLAKMAVGCGIGGLVCSAEETAGLRSQWGEKIVLVVPGIRPAGADTGDQKRIASPQAAIASGASYLVVGRPITRAADPAQAAESILREMG